jgi:hypothetical protein
MVVSGSTVTDVTVLMSRISVRQREFRFKDEILKDGNT